MKPSVMLSIASLLSLLLLTFHLAHDIVRGFEPGGLANLVGVLLISAVWLCGALLLSDRKSGHIIMLLGGLLAMFVPYVHMKGKGVGVASRLAGTSGHFFFVWTLIAIGVLGLFTRHPRGAWAVEHAMAPAPLVQHQRGPAA
jgi:mannitol-specific phosphotransferase system IIBC component